MPKRLHRIILLDQNIPIKQTADGAGQLMRLQQPPYLFDWSQYSAVNWVLRYQSNDGAPSSFSLTPKFQLGQINTIDYQDMNPLWTDFDTNQNAALQGGAWTAITSAGYYSRVVFHPPTLMRIDLSSLAFVGGTNPAARLSLIAYPLS